jgi:hypothetical protein
MGKLEGKVAIITVALAKSNAGLQELLRRACEYADIYLLAKKNITISLDYPYHRSL